MELCPGTGDRRYIVRSLTDLELHLAELNKSWRDQVSWRFDATAIQPMRENVDLIEEVTNEFREILREQPR